jgi:hypothetical protein
METFIEREDPKFALQLNNFCETIDTYKVLLGLDNDKVNALKQSSALAVFIITFNGIIQTFAEGFTAYKNLMRYGEGNQVLGPIPVPPVLSVDAPDVTNANVQKQFAEMIQDCVRSSNFTRSIGEQLGIVKPISDFNAEAGQPIIKTKLAEGGHPLLHVKKGGYEGYILYKSTGGSFVKVDKILHPDYLDHDPLPAPGERAVWRYKAIYLYKDKPAGSESAVVDVQVFGGAA